MAELSQSTQKLIQRYQAWYSFLQPREDIPTIHVDEVASAVAGFYEKIREVVDWREEHLMRRAAIERILKRRLLLLKNGKEIALPLILELIRGGHFPNDRIPESKIEEIQKLINKYIFILENSPSRPKEKQKVHLYDWILGIAACEIEETLSPSIREKALIEYMTELMAERIRIREGILVFGGLTEEEKNTQIYIAVQKALLKLDLPIISYNLLKRRYPQWPELTKDHSQLQEIAQNIYSIWESLEKEASHPLADKFYQVCEKYDTPYLILGDIISEDPIGIQEKIEEPAELENRIVTAYQKRLKILKSRVKRAAIYATLSIFVSKMLLAFAVEVPFDKYITGQFSYSTIGLNILIPPLLMFFLVLTIRPPKKENLQQVIMEVMKIAYQRERREIYTITPAKKRGWLMNAIITIFYLFTFIISFGLIIWGLQKLNFGILSIIIFLIFISLISFAGVKIRERSRELEVMEKKESFLMFFIDFFSLPVIRVGKWLSAQWARYNVIIILINFLIDLPFQSFVEFLEQWRAFLKEKKEEIH
jgi:gamma-glutamylcyclotransferase (GGCT)/AIG2-like uncharacterized protein YtfP